MRKVRGLQTISKHPRDLPQEDDHGKADPDLHCNHGGQVVVLVPDPQGRVHHDCEEGVHGADVVEHVVIAQGEAAEEDQEVQAPHHLRSTVQYRHNAVQ